MSQHIYHVGIGGEVSRENYDDIERIITQEGEVRVEMDDYGTQGVLCLSNPDGYWGEDDLIEMTDYLEEHDLPYRIEGYSTASDVYYVEWWKPGMPHTESIDTNDSWEEPDSNDDIIAIIDSLDDTKFTKENLKARIAQMRPKSEIPLVTWLEK